MWIRFSYKLVLLVLCLRERLMIYVSSRVLGREFETLQAHHSSTLRSQISLPLFSQFLHDGLDEGFGAFHAAEDGLEVEGGLVGVPARRAIDAVLADHDE
jgi:hypothetical protein